MLASQAGALQGRALPTEWNASLGLRASTTATPARVLIGSERAAA